MRDPGLGGGGHLLEGGVGAEPTEPGLADEGGEADPAELVDPERTPAGDLEQPGHVGVIVVEHRDLAVEDPVAALAVASG